MPHARQITMYPSLAAPACRLSLIPPSTLHAKTVQPLEPKRSEFRGGRMLRVFLVFLLLVLLQWSEAFTPSLSSSALSCGESKQLKVRASSGLRAVVCPNGAVALTRELGKNSKLATVLQKKDIETIEIPCIEFEDGDDIERLPSALQEDWEYVVITSPEAAGVFLKGWNEAGTPSLRVASVGAGTQQMLQQGGVEPVFVPSKATGKTLAAELPGPEKGGRVLYPASAKARTEVQGGLTARGFACTRLNTYDTVSATWSAEQHEQARSAAVVALASPSAVKTWVEYVGAVPAAACIGETSAKACKEAGFKHVFWPEKPGIEGWADAVIDALQYAEAK